MAFDFASVGDISAWAQGNSEPQTKVTDLAAHVDGGQVSARGAMQVGALEVKASVFDSAIVVGIGLALLWILGAFSFKTFNL